MEWTANIVVNIYFDIAGVKNEEPYKEPISQRGPFTDNRETLSDT